MMLQQKKWQRQSMKFENSFSVYVAGLPPQTSYWDLRNALAQFGEVCATFVSTLKPHQTHKYGFGCFKTRSAVVIAAQSKLVVHGELVTIRRRTKNNWKNKDNSALPSSLEGIKAEPNSLVSSAIHSGFPVISDMTVQYLQLAGHFHLKNSVPAMSPFVPPPNFTEYVHDTIASQYQTKGRLQAALQPHAPSRFPQHFDGGSSPTRACNNESVGTVARVDGVPATWEAVDLFNFLSERGIIVTSALVYDDFDERGLRQALIQLISFQDVQALCDVGSLQSQNVHLRFATSCIQSIGPVRRTHAGNFTAYNDCPLPSEAYGYSVAEPVEPSPIGNADIGVLDSSLSFRSAMESRSASLSDKTACSTTNFASDGACSISVGADTPDTVVGPGSPLAKVCRNEGGEDSANDNCDVDEGPVCATSYFMSRKDNGLVNESTTQQNHLVLTKTSPMHQTKAPPKVAPFCGPPQMPLIFPKASQTVIVDNFDTRLVGNRENLSKWVSQFGEIQSIDLVPLEGHRTRAYISYMSPIEAQYTMHHLQLCMSGSFRLMVRLA